MCVKLFRRELTQYDAIILEQIIHGAVQRPDGASFKHDQRSWVSRNVSLCVETVRIITNMISSYNCRTNSILFSAA